MGIADIGKREEQRAQDGAGFGFEAKLVDDVLGGAVLVIIDVDGVKDFVVEIEIVRSVPRLLSRNNVGNEHYFAWVLPTAKRVCVRIIRRRIQRDQRRLSVARRADRCGCPCHHERRDENRDSLAR